MPETTIARLSYAGFNAAAHRNVLNPTIFMANLTIDYLMYTMSLDLSPK